MLAGDVVKAALEQPEVPVLVDGGLAAAVARSPVTANGG